MLRFRAISQIAAVVVVLSLLLTACRVADVPATAYPAVGSYPGPRTQAPTRAPTAAVKTTVPPVVPTPTSPPSPAPTTAVNLGEVAFTLTIVHSGEVAGEVVPCG